MALGAAPVERRKADDGWWYTKEQFWRYYGDDSFWNRAEQAGAPPSAAESDAAHAEPGASQPDAPAAAGAESVAAPDASGALEPGPSVAAPRADASTLGNGAADAAGAAAALHSRFAAVHCCWLRLQVPGLLLLLTGAATDGANGCLMKSMKLNSCH